MKTAMQAGADGARKNRHVGNDSRHETTICAERIPPDRRLGALMCKPMVCAGNPGWIAPEG
jgi:hypothetical protein